MNVGFGAKSLPGAEPNADVVLPPCEPVKEKVDFNPSVAVVEGAGLLEPEELGAAADPNGNAGLAGALLEVVLPEGGWLEADVVLPMLGVNENIGFGGVSLPTAGASFVAGGERWLKKDGAPPDGVVNENVGLGVVANDDDATFVPPEEAPGWPNAGVLFDGANENFAVPLPAGAVEAEVSSFPNANEGIEPDEPNAVLPNEETPFEEDVSANENVLFAVVVVPVDGELVLVVGNKLVDVPVPKTGLGAASDEPLALVAIVPAPASVCFPKAFVKDGAPKPPPKAGAVAPAAPEKLEVDADSFLVSPVVGGPLEEDGGPKVNFGLLSVVEEAVAVESAELAGSCPNENFGGEDAAILVVVVAGVAEKEKTGVDGFNPGGTVVDGAEDAFCQVEDVGVKAGVAAPAAAVGVEAEGVEGAWAGTLGLANEKAGALAAPWL